MTNEEKIRLVLDVLGVDNVSKARKELADLNQQLNNVGAASGQAAGSRGINGQGLLAVAYAVDDLQYGMRGIMNNIPMLAQALGLGAGLAGAAGIAAVAIGQLTQRHPEWFDWSDKVKKKLIELTDAVKAEEEAVNRQKKTIDELSQKTNIRYEDLLKLIKATDDLKEKEQELDEQRAKIKSAEEQAKNPGEIAAEQVSKMKAAYDEAIVQPGFAKGVQDAAIRNRFGQLRDETDLADGVKQIAGQFGRNFEGDVNRLMYAEGDESMTQIMSRQDAEKTVKKEYLEKYLPLLDRELRNQAENEVKTMIGAMQKATKPEEFNKALLEFQRVNPVAAQAAIEQFQFTQSAEAEDKILAESIAEVRGATARSKAFADRMAAIGPTRKEFEDAQNQNAIINRTKGDKQNLLDQQQTADIRNQALGQFDPLQAAILRRQQAGVGGMSRRNLQALEQRDIRNFQQLLMNQGMGRGEAEQAAMESLRGGEASFQDMARGLGFSLDTVADGFRASVAVMQQLNQTVQRIDGENQALRQQLQVMGNGDNRAPARPQLRRRLNN